MFRVTLHTNIWNETKNKHVRAMNTEVFTWNFLLNGMIFSMFVIVETGMLRLMLNCELNNILVPPYKFEYHMADGWETSVA